MFSITMYETPNQSKPLGSCQTFIAASVRMFHLFQNKYRLVCAADHGDWSSYYWREDNKPAVRVIIRKEE